MPTATLRWRNLNIAIRVKINNGAVYICAMLAAFAYAVLSNWIKPMADNFLAGQGAIWAISATMLAQQYKGNQLDVEAAKANVFEELNRIKSAAAGISVEMESAECEQK